MENPDRAGKIDALAAELVGPGVLGNYVVIGEVVDANGMDLRVVVSSGLAPWTAKGMLVTALDILDAQVPRADDEYEDE